MGTYYQILGIPATAAAADIKRAYRQLAIQLHPDVNPSPLAQAQFVQVQQAYQVLSQPDRRRQYDHWLRTGQAVPAAAPAQARPAAQYRPRPRQARGPFSSQAQQPYLTLEQTHGLVLAIGLTVFSVLCTFTVAGAGYAVLHIWRHVRLPPGVGVAVLLSILLCVYGSFVLGQRLADRNPALVRRSARWVYLQWFSPTRRRIRRPRIIKNMTRKLQTKLKMKR